jgi:hypothetical protein
MYCNYHTGWNITICGFDILIHKFETFNIKYVDCSQPLASGVIPLSFQAQRGPVNTIFVHCRVCRCCVVASGFVMYVLCPFFVNYLNKNQ